MLLFLPRSIRSLWSPLSVVVGLVFFLIGLIVATDSSDIASVVIGLAGGGLGLGFAYGGARTGVFMTQRGLTVREFFAVESYGELEQAQVRRLTRTPTASTPPSQAVSSPVPQASDGGHRDRAAAGWRR